MTEPDDDKVSARYRELARELPPGDADAAILAAARGPAPATREASRAGSGARPRFSQWAGPVSIAAVLVLGIGVSLRMQLEQPGIETSLPAQAPPESPTPIEPKLADRAAERHDAPPATSAPEPARAPAPSAPKSLRKERAASAPPREEPQRNATEQSVPRPFPDASPAQAAAAPTPPAVTAPTPAAPPPAVAAAPMAAPPSAAKALGNAQAPAGATASISSLSAAPAPRAKREAESAADSAGGAREMRRAGTEPDPDPIRELERIAGLRAAGNHAEADRALEQFRRGHPDFKIPDALWERVKPR